MEKPRVIIVDANNQEIGVKARSEIDYTQDIYRDAAIWMTNSSGDVLIAQRKLTKDKDPGLWGPAAAGTIEEGETYQTNAYKELGEELGVTEVELKQGKLVYYSSPRKRFTQWFSCVCDLETHEFKPQQEEVEQIRWINPQELIADYERNPNKFVPTFGSALNLFGLIK